jgi:hypothetical protein
MNLKRGGNEHINHNNRRRVDKVEIPMHLRNVDENFEEALFKQNILGQRE